uniref:WW domain-containing protein n=2 Tax=Mantoniella antarctica TaxID=81844 RepID=A0A7S0XDR1_9CHLO|mmetsp:Transcript_33056/g.83361  ORF Transcript_33056/g.83361 Transcript_33056/m.83361 type:complete len:226 (+) Transcript_33056:69-746(+)
MEKHHKLRRPAGSSIHGCNICGVEGHQAAQCTNGTVNWSQKRSHGVAQAGGVGGASKEPDYADMAAQARAFAAKRLADEEAIINGIVKAGGDEEVKETVRVDTSDGADGGAKKRGREDAGREDETGKGARTEAAGATSALSAALNAAASGLMPGPPATYGHAQLSRGPVVAAVPVSAPMPVPPPPPPVIAPAAPASAWRVYYDQLGRPYYHNSASGVTQWTPPVV